MEYEIKSISPSSVLKISFVVILTVSCIFVFLLSLMAMSLVSSMGDALSGMPLLEGMGPLEFNFGTILFSSVFNGILLALFIVFFLILAVIFYNIYVSHFGGIVIQLQPENDLTIQNGETSDE